MKHQFQFSIIAAIKSLRILFGEGKYGIVSDMTQDYSDACRPCKNCGLSLYQVFDQVRTEEGCAWNYVNGSIEDDCELRQRRAALKAFW